MTNPRQLSIEDYDYALPDSAIAVYPPENRDASRLMTCIRGRIQPDHFRNIGHYLRKGDLLILNETKVIPARLHFRKETGARIEIFCLRPYETDYQQAMQNVHSVTWEVMIGGAKKWKSGTLRMNVRIDGGELNVIAERIFKEDDKMIVCFRWDNTSVSFSRILEAAGELPLPPYFDRKAEAADYERYQTVFARWEGSVAAPTAGLHFTDDVLQELNGQGVDQAKVVLHVGSGTFKPVSSGLIGNHEMHGEIFDVSTDFVDRLMSAAGRIIPVGTTSMRTVESLYWLGVKCITQPETLAGGFVLEQWEPYELPQHYSSHEALRALLHYCSGNKLDRIAGSTSVIIAPGYTLRLASGIITNFHLPKSTLILLVAAIVGEQWRDVYAKALESDFRFLSYGDSSILIP